MKFRPCIDIHQGKVKQIVGGTLNNALQDLVENFISDQNAGYYAGIFKKHGLTGGHIIMLGPGNIDEALKALWAFPGGLQIGGGINPENAGFFIEHGASHVIVTSYVFKNGAIDYDNLKQIISVVGKERLVLDLSCRKKDGKYFIVTDKWQKFTNVEINQVNLTELAGYCDEFLIHAADVEGLRQGMETELVQALGPWVKIPTTYAGGIKSLADIEKIRQLGAGKLDFTVGSALDIFGGDLPFEKVVEWRKKAIEN